MNVKVLTLLTVTFLFAQNILCQNLMSGIKGSSTYYEFAEDMKVLLPGLKNHESGGSIENFNKLMDDSSDINLAFMQYDVLLFNEIKEPKIKNKLKVVIPLYLEEIHLIAHKYGGISSIDDLKGKKVAIGSVSQGTNLTARYILGILGIDCEMIEVAYRDAFAALLNDKIEAFFFVAGVPVPNLESFSTEIGEILKLIPIESEKLSNIYEKTTISKEAYNWLDSDIRTYAVRSLLMTNIDKSSHIIPELLKSIQDNYDDLISNPKYHAKWKEVKLHQSFTKWELQKDAKQYFNVK